MNFKISLIGRVNVGKSTLFNKLTKCNKSLVSNIPGITRDRKYGEFIYNKKNNEKIYIIDTGALINFPNIKFSEKVYYQTKLAINESNIIFFVIENDISLNNDDLKIFNILKFYEKEIILIINKIDKIKNYLNKFLYFNIKKIYYISAKNNIGLKNLIKDINSFNKNIIFINNKKNNIENNFNKNINKYIKILILGKSNVGKSTFINRIINNNRLIISNYAGTTLENIDVDIKYKDSSFIFTDTSGINNNLNLLENNFKISLNEIIYKKLIVSNIIIFIINIIDDITNKEISIINNINKLGKSIILIVNKIDLLNKKDKIIKKEIIENKLSFIKKNIKIYYISALYISEFNYIKSYLYKLYNILNKNFKTKLINDTLRKAVSNHKPNYIKPLLKPKLKYAYILYKNPLKLIIHGKNLNYINTTYKKYLINFFKKELNLKSISINISFKNE